jgi:hypothetical protein
MYSTPCHAGPVLKQLADRRRVQSDATATRFNTRQRSGSVEAASGDGSEEGFQRTVA